MLKFKHTCDFCGSEFTADRNAYKGVPIESLRFCAVDCIFDHIRGSRGMETWHRDELARVGNHKTIQQEPPEFYSVLLSQWFRSFYEVFVAEALTVQGIRFEYEEYQFPVTVGGKAKYYIPDFRLPDIGLFLEVKGLWGMGARDKFAVATQVFKPANLLILPARHYREFSKLATTKGAIR